MAWYLRKRPSQVVSHKLFVVTSCCLQVIASRCSRSHILTASCMHCSSRTCKLCCSTMLQLLKTILFCSWRAALVAVFVAEQQPLGAISRKSRAGCCAATPHEARTSIILIIQQQQWSLDQDSWCLTAKDHAALGRVPFNAVLEREQAWSTGQECAKLFQGWPYKT